MKNMLSGQTTLSIDKKTKQRAEIVAKKMHLTLSGVARILLNDFADGKIRIATVMTPENVMDFPSDEKAVLAESLNDVKKGKKLEGPFKNAKEFIKSLK